MPSPFPGMNPYLEQQDVWHDFHERFLPAAAEEIGRQVKPAYIVKIDEHVFIHELGEPERTFLGRTDLGVARTERSRASEAQAAVLAAPARGRLLPAVDAEHLAFVEIRDRRDRQLITVVELLSPSNKQHGPDREQYLGKRRRLCASAVHFVELDLLRGGPRMPLEALPECAYLALVSRAEERPDVSLWPVRLRDPLPVIPIPLRAGEPEARLDLQNLLHRVYDAAGYEYYIYAGEPQPALAPEDAAWARALIPAAPPPAAPVPPSSARE